MNTKQTIISLKTSKRVFLCLTILSGIGVLYMKYLADHTPGMAALGLAVPALFFVFIGFVSLIIFIVLQLVSLMKKK